MRKKISHGPQAAKARPAVVLSSTGWCLCYAAPLYHLGARATLSAYLCSTVRCPAGCLSWRVPNMPCWGAAGL